MEPKATKAAADNRAGQLSDHDPRYHLARGASPAEAERLAREARATDAKNKDRK